ncbi:hypothetical protein [Corynebacterium cystitidis]|uniref:hypothetical protein n=1 Tax=Corynebacterium cystitidis TaxID=35757 RepID=UPI00211E2DE6|nr:hypothetical protein [Corynebacterium cystitidis]
MPLIFEHEEAVELDLLDRGIDYRDFYRPGGGPSQLTLRRLLLIVDDLDMFGSRFWSKVNGLEYFPNDIRIQTDLFGMFSEKPHPLRTWREDMRREEEKQEKKRAIERAMKERQRRLANV